MTRSIVWVGLTNQTATVEHREALARELPERCGRLLPDFRSQSSGNGTTVAELVVLASRGRVECFAALDGSGPRRLEALFQLLAEATGIPFDIVKSRASVLAGSDAIRRLDRLAAGEEPQAPDEPPLSRQLPEAIERADRSHTSGPRLQGIFRRAMHLRRSAPRETAVAEPVMAPAGDERER